MYAALHLVVEDGVDRMHIWSACQPDWRFQRENVVNMSSVSLYRGQGNISELSRLCRPCSW